MKLSQTFTLLNQSFRVQHFDNGYADISKNSISIQACHLSSSPNIINKQMQLTLKFFFTRKDEIRQNEQDCNTRHEILLSVLTHGRKRKPYLLFVCNKNGNRLGYLSQYVNTLVFMLQRRCSVIFIPRGCHFIGPMIYIISYTF